MENAAPTQRVGAAFSRVYREILIFLPNEGASATPLETARALIKFLPVGRADAGVDALTGSVELRLHDDPALYLLVQNYLRAANVVYEIERR